MTKIAILEVGVMGDKFIIHEENEERANTLLKSGQALQMPSDIMLLQPEEMKTVALGIRKDKMGF